MADRGVSFAGDGMKDVDMNNPNAGFASKSLSSGGPVSGGPESNPGMTTDSMKPDNWLDTPPTGSGSVKFAGDVDK